MELINLAEIRLFTGAGSQYSRSQLGITMSSIWSQPLGPEMCLDGNLNNLCATLDGVSGDPSPWLRVTYPCQDGLSRVEVINRADCCQSRIVQYRMRAMGAGDMNDLASPYSFSATQGFYYWQLSGTPLGELAQLSAALCLC